MDRNNWNTLAQELARASAAAAAPKMQASGRLTVAEAKGQLRGGAQADSLTLAGEQQRQWHQRDWQAGVSGVIGGAAVDGDAKVRRAPLLVVTAGGRGEEGGRVHVVPCCCCLWMYCCAGSRAYEIHTLFGTLVAESDTCVFKSVRVCVLFL